GYARRSRPLGLPAFRNAADSWLLHVRGDRRRRVQGQAAGLRLVAAARTAARPDGVAAVTHRERDQRAGREAGAAGRTDVPAPAWPATPATTRWGFYPRVDQVRSKIGTNLTLPKLPLWWWTDKLAAWPFSVEWLSSAFDFNVAPFYQSFVE